MRKQLMIYVACALAGVWVSPWTGLTRVAFEVRDSKGRVRITSNEVGNAFSLCMLDQDGKPRLILGAQADGSPLVLLMNAKGDECGMLGQLAGGAVIMRMRAESGSELHMESHPVDGAWMKIDDQDGRPLAFLGSAAKTKETALVLRGLGDAEENRVRVWAAGPSRSSRGLSVETAGKKVAGLGVAKDTIGFWIGDDALNGSDSGNGVRMGFTPGVGPVMTLRRDVDSPSILLQDLAKGTGMQVGSPSTGMVKSGVSAQGVPKLRLEQKGGEVLLEVPVGGK